ncbi:MAG TPA: hypothetical protein VH913_22490 [Hyphomicrobiaceae bacterium]|jgi:hypothetical protein
MKTLGSLAATVLLALAVPALAQNTTTPKSGAAKMSQADCTAAWSKADTAKSGNLSQSQARGIVTNFKAADSNNDGKLSRTEFTAACDKGLVMASGATGSGGRGMTGNDEPSSTTKPGGKGPAK